MLGRHKLISIASVAGALIMQMTYGMDIKSHEDKFLQAAERATDHIEAAMVPNAFLVDRFPICPFPGLRIFLMPG